MTTDNHPGRIRTLAGFLGDAERISTLEPITTRVRQLNPDMWPDAGEWSDDLRPSPIPPKA